MSAVDHRLAAPAGAITLFRLGAAFAGLRAWRRARATEMALRELTDGQLRDIGLERGEIAAVAESLARRG